MVPILFTKLDNTGYIVLCFLGSHRVLHCSNMSLGTVHIENQLLPNTSPYTLHILPGHAWQEDSLVAATNLSYWVQLLVAPCCTWRHMPLRALKRGDDAEGNSCIDLFWLTKGPSHHDDPKLRVLTSASVLLAAVEFL